VLKLAQASLLVALYFFVVNSARADLLIEPVAGWNAPTNLNIWDKNYVGNGGSAGGRVGFQKFGFQLGLDYLFSSIAFQNHDLPKKFNMNEWTIFAGFEFPAFLRVYGGFILSASAETKDSNGDPLILEAGSGSKVGLGFTGLPFLDINLEYRRGTWDQYKLDNVKTEKESHYNSILVAVSLPFTI